MAASEHKSDFELTTDTPYLAHTGELWGVFYENFEENSPRYNGTALYIYMHIYTFIYIYDNVFKHTRTRSIDILSKMTVLFWRHFHSLNVIALSTLNGECWRLPHIRCMIHYIYIYVVNTLWMIVTYQIYERVTALYDDVIKWKHFPRYWPFVWGIHRSPVNFLHKGQWRGALILSLICAWIYGWVNNREAGDLRRNHADYDVTVMIYCFNEWIFLICHCRS